MSAVVFLNENIYFNFEDGYIYKNGKKSKMHMEPQHTKLLKLLVSHSGSICTYDYIYEKIMSDESVVTPNVSRIRKLFKDLKLKNCFIDTINNNGYRGYRFCSDYHVVELLETAPNTIEPLTLKDNFVEEPELLDKIFRAFEEGNKIVFLSGISGSGKSELARSFCSKYKDSFCSVLNFALTPDGNGRFEDLLAENDKFFGDTGLDRDLKIKVRKGILNKLSKECLIIIDNFNSNKNLDFLNNLHDITSGALPTGMAKIIVTTQLQSDIFSAYINKGCKVIEVEKERNKQQLAYDIFAKHVGINDLNNEYINGIVNTVGYHPLTCSILGSQANEYGYDLQDLQDSLNYDFKKTLSNEETVWFANDRFNSDFTPYELLKIIFEKVSMGLSEIERQLLGALIILPKVFHEKDSLTELVGDIKGKNGCSLAKSALNKLKRKSLVEVDNDGKISLHPLLEQLYQDENFFNNGTTVAELSDEFKLHLSCLYFVSEYNFLPNKLSGAFSWNRYVYNSFAPLANINDYSDIDYHYAGWMLANSFKKSSKDIKALTKCINENQKTLGLSNTISEKLLIELLNGNTVGLYFIMEYEEGRALFLYEYKSKQEFCIINCSEGKKTHRYFGLDYHNCQNSNPTPIKCTFIGSVNHVLPEVLQIPEYIAGIPITEIYREANSFVRSNNTVRIISIPKSVNTIGFGSFDRCTALEQVVFMGNKINLENAFCFCYRLKHVFFPLSHCRIDGLSFYNTKIDKVIVPKGTEIEYYYDVFYENQLEEMLDLDGYYIPEKNDIKEFILIGADIDESGDGLNKLFDHQKDGETDLCKYHINDIYKCWRNKEDLWDTKNTKIIDWDIFYSKWQERINPNKRPFNSKKKRKGVLGENLIFDKKVMEDFGTNVLVCTDTSINEQISWLDATKQIERIITPFFDASLIIAETPYIHALRENSFAEDFVWICMERAKKLLDENKTFEANEYMSFVENFRKNRPEFFQEFDN